MGIPINRRTAIKIILAGAGAASGAFYLQRHGFRVPTSFDKGPDFSPIDRNLTGVQPRRWFGDDMDRAHRVLWNPPTERPDPTETVPLVVIGGGISGLATSYLLKDHSPVIIEQSERFGGNAKGQHWEGIDYSIGAAYFVVPEEDDEFDRFYKELELDRLWKLSEESNNPVLDSGRLAAGFWEGEVRSSEKPQAEKLKRYFVDTWNEENGASYPDIPYEEDKAPLLKRLDAVDLMSHLESVAGGKLLPGIARMIESYCWTSFGASAREISAATGMNFYSAEFGEIAVCPGGNSAVAEALLNRLSRRLPDSCFRTRSMVYDVETADDRVVVRYTDPEGRPRAIAAKAAVMACPKFVVKRVLQGIEEERKSAIEKLRYRGVTVTNILIDAKYEGPDLYEVFLMNGANENEDKDWKSIEARAKAQGATDVIYANFASGVRDKTVLTLYQGLPFDSGRPELMAGDSHANFRSAHLRQAVDTVFPVLGFKESQIHDVRAARWGHGFVSAAPGFISTGGPQLLRKPFKDRVFFVEQDNWAMPAIETSLAEAFHFAPRIRELLT